MSMRNALIGISFLLLSPSLNVFVMAGTVEGPDALCVGEEVTYTRSGLPDPMSGYPYIWSSSDPSKVAVVDADAGTFEGKALSLTKGDVTITVDDTLGNSASKSVTVVELKRIKITAGGSGNSDDNNSAGNAAPVCADASVTFEAIMDLIDVGGSGVEWSVLQPGGVWQSQGTGKTMELTLAPPDNYEVKAECGAKSVKIFVVSFKVDILAPEENDVHLKGEEVEFEGMVEPTGLSGVTYAWSVTEGTCDPYTGTSADFETTLKSEGAIKVKLAVTVGETTCEKERTIEAMLPEVVKLSWNDDKDLYSGHNGTTSIDDPVWVKTLGGAVTKDEPGAYVKSASAMAELEIKASKSLSYSTGVEVRGQGVAANDENFYSDSATFHHWTWTSGELVLQSSPLYASVNFYDTLDVQWQYRVQNLSGGWGDWVDMNATSHDLYTVMAAPKNPEAIPHADILDYACRWAANATSEDGVCTDILNNGFIAHYTWTLNCDRLASDFVRLVGCVGISSSQHQWASKGFYDPDTGAGSGNVGEMCYQRTKSFTPVGGSAGVREWSWHQWAEAAGSQRDPSAGTSNPGAWGGYEDDLFTHYLECTSTSPFGATWVGNQAGQSSGCEVYPTNCDYTSSPTLWDWKGPD